jgi:bifunctional DNase/RNase
MVEMELLGVRLELPGNTPVVLLREREGDRRVLPIYIGPEEARAIALALEGVETPRPMTHDLMRDLLGAIDVEVRSITVTDLQEATFFAEVELVSGERVVRVSSRPSDAVALAVRVDAPIYADEAVLAEAAMPAAEEGEEDQQEEIVEEFKEFIDQVNPEDFAS